MTLHANSKCMQSTCNIIRHHLDEWVCEASIDPFNHSQWYGLREQAKGNACGLSAFPHVNNFRGTNMKRFVHTGTQCTNIGVPISNANNIEHLNLCSNLTPVLPNFLESAQPTKCNHIFSKASPTWEKSKCYWIVCTQCCSYPQIS